MRNLQMTFHKDRDGKPTSAPDQGKCKAMKDVRIGSYRCRECRYSTLDKFDLSTLYTAATCECTHKKNQVSDDVMKMYKFETDGDNFELIDGMSDIDALKTFIEAGRVHCFGMTEIDDDYNETRVIDWRALLNAMPYDEYQNIEPNTINQQKPKAMKMNETNAQDNVTNVTTNPETAPAQGMQDAQELTPEQVKAQKILKARLPKLAEAGLNFEKRTGAFFRASLAKVQKVDENGEPMERNGQPVWETDDKGQPIEKVRRIVVDLNHESEAETVANCIDDMNAKRAAVLVLEGEKRRVKLETELAAARQAVDECTQALNSFDHDMGVAVEIVNNTEIPERVSAPRVAVAAKLESMQNEMAKMRALLLAAGIDPDAQ